MGLYKLVLTFLQLVGTLSVDAGTILLYSFTWALSLCYLIISPLILALKLIIPRYFFHLVFYHFK